MAAQVRTWRALRAQEEVPAKLIVCLTPKREAEAWQEAEGPLADASAVANRNLDLRTPPSRRSCAAQTPSHEACGGFSTEVQSAALIRRMFNEALGKMEGMFAQIYEADIKVGRSTHCAEVVVAGHAAAGALQHSLRAPAHGRS